MILNIRIRASSREDYSAIARIHVDSWKTTYKGIISQDYLDSLSITSREPWWKDVIADSVNIVFVAEVISVPIDGESSVIGFIKGGPNRSAEYASDYAAELGALYLTEDYRQKGVGTRLVAHLVKELRKRDFNSMLVWVLASNPYRRFYERLGGKYVSSGEILIGESSYEKVSYGWKDLSSASGAFGEIR